MEIFHAESFLYRAKVYEKTVGIRKRKGKQREMRQAGGENVFDSENVAGKIACKQARGDGGKEKL